MSSSPPKSSKRTKIERPLEQDVAAAIASLKRLSSKATRAGMARYGIPSDKAFGVPVGKMQQLAKQLGRNHELALALWTTGWYEARMLAAFLDEPERVTAAQMDAWCNDFDSWAICDTVCFHLFDRTPHAWRKVEQWAKRREEFVKRGAFALLACLALHDKNAGDATFLRCLPLIEKAAVDERNFVKKGVSWAFRLIGRRNLKLHTASLDLARHLSESPASSARWIGKGAVKELTATTVVRRLKPEHSKPPSKSVKKSSLTKNAAKRGKD
jgi:3-methyladenine DNA glycosylase AlkD